MAALCGLHAGTMLGTMLGIVWGIVRGIERPLDVKMIRFRSIMLWLVCGALATAVAQADNQPINGHEPAAALSIDQVTFARDKPAVHVYVTIENKEENSPRPNPGAVQVEEDGRLFAGEVRVDRFQASGRRLGYVLALDNRESLPFSLTMIIEGSQTVIKGLGFRHRGAVMSYTGQSAILAGPTMNVAHLLEKMGKITPTQGSPHLVDGLCLAVQAIGSIQNDERTAVERLVVILFTDGLDSGSLLRRESCERLLMESGVTLHVIGYGLPDTDGLRRMAWLAEQTGGSFQLASSYDKFPMIITSLVDRLQNQLVLTFRPQALHPDGQAHRVKVRVLQGKTWLSDSYHFTAPRLRWARTWPRAAVVVVVLLVAVAALVLPFPRWRFGRKTTVA